LARLGDLEKTAYVTAAVGTVTDHFSTQVALLSPRIRELNQFTLLLRELGLWIHFDVFLFAFSLLLPAAIMRRSSFKGRWGILVFPLFYGAARLAAAIHNVFVLYSTFFI